MLPGHQRGMILITEGGEGQGMSLRHRSSRTHPIPPEIEDVASQVLDAAFALHSALGPGLLEKVYVKGLAWMLEEEGLQVETEVPVPVEVLGRRIPVGLRLDLLVEDTVVVEAKGVEELHPNHEVQLVTYLETGGYPIGFLMNFHEARLKNGLVRKIGKHRFG